ncbi:pentatricopeptide repeat-containing protein At2g15820, chloroplastic [Andrographis paniculata]|uniref:pentatricopeptide repeat-containing protein At2g15820, chloroplastic n=1 Tax=Andrographis paniculata TaxID=175694 RepID=UPI0021E8DA76|nr:pentatricopeptide repeat-containing protein At2g15820, chloroplastic [Andrographis paniculata]
MLLSLNCTNSQIISLQDNNSCSFHRRRCRISLASAPYLKVALSIAASSSSAGASVSHRIEEEKENESDFYKWKQHSFDEPFDLTELKRFETPSVEVKELEELPDQWRRSRLAWLCKELPAHRSGTFIRVLNAQRKWIRQDDCTYIAVHCMRIRENESAFRVYKWMMHQRWFCFDFALATKLADYMGKERKHLKCREIFDDIINQGRVPNESTFHILIVAYLSSSPSSCLDEACSIYNKMIHLGGYKPRLSLHNSLFRALVAKTGLSSKHHLRQAEFIFHNLTACGLKVHSDIYGGLIWLHSYQDTVDKERIAALRTEMKSAGFGESTDILVSVLRACAKGGDVTEAERTWTKILSSTKKPPTQAYLYLMDVYSRDGKPEKSLEIFRELQGRTSCNVALFYRIIQILCKAREIKLAESVMVEFVNSGMKPLTQSFVDMMSMYAELNLHGKVEITFFRCLKHCHPNETIYNLYLDSLVQTNNLDKAEEIFNQMCADETIGVDAKSCNAILRGYLAVGNNAKAETVHSFMQEKKYEVEASSMEKLQSIATVNDEEVKEPVSLKLGKEQREIIIGLLMGGLRIVIEEEKKSHAVHFVFRENCEIHSSLKRHIYDEFHEWFAFKLLVEDKIPSRFSAIPHPCFKFYGDQFWPKGIPAVPNLIHRWLTPRVIAYWYMYGGYRTSSGDILLKLKFSKDDVLRIAKTIKSKGLSCRVKKKGTAFWMGFLGSDAMGLWELIEPYVLTDLKELLEAGTISTNGSSGTDDVNSSNSRDSDGYSSDNVDA